MTDHTRGTKRGIPSGNEPPTKKARSDENEKPPVTLKEYSIDIKGERLNNKIYRIFFINIARRILSLLQFKFEFKYSHNSWQPSRIFDCKSLRIWKETDEIFTYIRVPSQLCDYKINIRLALKFTRNINGYLSHEWMKHSNTLSMTVLSSLITAQFNVGSYVKFRPPGSGTFYYGKIAEISCDESSNIDNELLTVCKIKENCGKIWDNIATKVLLQVLADDYIDFCVLDRNNADFELLFKSNKLTKDTNEFNIYCCLVECGMNISQNISNSNNIEMSAQGRCFAYNVMAMLVENKIDYNLKLNCLKDCGSYLHTKQLMTVIKYRFNIGKGAGWTFGCDICRTSVNEYDYMFHCDNIKQLTHDFCVLCAYEMIQKHKQLTGLLYPILLQNESLNVFCIDILVSFMVGKVNKFKISYV